MDDKLLVKLGFKPIDARAYRILATKRSLRPSQLSKLIGESRENCYSILDRLVESGLAIKEDINRKLTYSANSPEVLLTILQNQITETQHKMREVERKLPQMITAYNNSPKQPKIGITSGLNAVEKKYDDHLSQQNAKELYFLRSVSDIHYIPLQRMKEIRLLAKKYNKKRYGITPIVVSRPTKQQDQTSNLARTWLKKGEYISPVEWAVIGDEIHIYVFSDDVHCISINHPLVAESLTSIFKLMSKYIKNSPGYAELAKSKVQS